MSEPFQLNRRDLLRHILVLAGASTTAGFSFPALAEAARGATRFLEKPAFDSLSAVADTIIPVTDTPGALAAEVPERLDALMLNWAAPDTREMLVGALARIDAAALVATGEAFANLSAEGRKAFLVDYDRAALQPVPPPADEKKTHPFMPAVHVVDKGYHRLKSLVISLYYISEIGLTEELVYEHVPGAWVPSLKITPGMRPFAGTGLI